MATSEGLRTVLRVVETAARGSTALTAVQVLAALAPETDTWDDAAPLLAGLADDPRFAHDRRQLLCVLAEVPVPSVRAAVERLARDPSSPDRIDALDALVEAGVTEHLPALVHELLARLPGTAERLAALPLEAVGIEPETLRPALEGVDADHVLFAAVAAGRLGDLVPLSRVLDRLADGELPPLLEGEARTSHARIARAHPVPAALREWCEQRLPAARPEVSLVLLALTGRTAEGDVVDVHLPVQQQPDAVVPPDLQLVARLTREPFDGRGRLVVGEYELRRLGNLPGHVAARLVETLLEKAAESIGSQQPSEAGSGLMRVVAALPPALPLDVPRVLRAWRTGRVVPPGQLALLLARADHDALLDALAPDLQAPDPDRQGQAVELLHRALSWSDTRPSPSIPDASHAAAPPAAEPAARGPATPAEPSRHLLAEVVAQKSGKVRRHSFAPGATHRVGIAIGPATADGLVLPSPFPDRQVVPDGGLGAVLEIELVVPGAAGTTRQRSQLLLPPTGSSAQAQFTVEAPSSGELTMSVLVFQGARLLQSAELTGPVSVTDAPVDGSSLRLLCTAELQPVISGTVTGPLVDASVSFHVGGDGEALLVGSGGDDRLLQVSGLEALQAQVVTQLRKALAADSVDGASPGSRQQVRLLRSLARLGNQLHQVLAPQLHGIEIDHGLQVISREDQTLPLELVYDFGFPTRTARLCKTWGEALATGTCPRCRPRDGSTGTVCPLGFWGVRLVLERQLAGLPGADGTADPAGQPQPGRQTLPALDRVLFAASARVDAVSADERKRTVAHLHEHLGDGCCDVDTWTEWRRAVKQHKPGLLLSLPHNEATEEGLSALEIGDHSLLDVPAVGDEHVLPPGASVGPVVMLLGCNTAVAKVPWQSAAAQFRRRGASVVVGTLAESLGRQSAPMARHVADALWGPQAVSGATMGEVMQGVRRRLVADGATLGLSLVAFGHAGWLVAEPER